MVKQGQLCRISKTFFFVLNIASWSEISDVFLALLMIFYLPGTRAIMKIGNSLPLARGNILGWILIK